MTDAQEPEHHTTHADEVHLVDWHRVGRRVRASALVLGGLAVLAWVVTGAVGDGIVLSDLWNWIGLGLLAMFVAEVIFVGGSALRGMLRAGEEGERLAGGDVGILPPQVTRRIRRRE